MKKSIIASAGATVLGASIVALGAALDARQAPQTQQASSPAQTADISGLWNRLDTGGGGSYHGIDLMFPRAELLPEYAARLPPEVDEGLGATTNVPSIKAANGAYLTPQAALAGGPSPTAGRCNVGGGGGGGIDINSAGMNIVQSTDEVDVLRDGAAGGRHIYLNKKMPDPSRIPAAGYSIGRWENGHFIVTTTGLQPGMTGFGRGWHERDTVLTEEFKPSSDGRRLDITYTWSDPKVYAKPLVYTISFERFAGIVQENWCDASIDHPENYTSIIPPAENAGKK